MPDTLPTTVYVVELTHPDNGDPHHRGTVMTTPGYWLQTSAQAAADEWNAAAQARGTGRTYRVVPLPMAMWGNDV